MSLDPGPSSENGSDRSSCDMKMNLNSKFEEIAAQEEDSMQIDDDCMKVFLRLRPMLKDEINSGYEECFNPESETTLRSIPPQSRSVPQAAKELNESYSFSKVFPDDVRQSQIFEDTMMDPMLSFIEGQNCLIFAYGNSGSGKTYTMQGGSSEPGIIPLTVQLLFECYKGKMIVAPKWKPDKFIDVCKLERTEIEIEEKLKNSLLQQVETEDNDFTRSYLSINSMFLEESVDVSHMPDRPEGSSSLINMRNRCWESTNQQGKYVYGMWISFVEVYNEKIYDLLQPVTEKRPKLNVGQDKNKNIYVKGMREVFVENSSEVFKLLRVGRKNLKIASTKLNHSSSRSHCIFNVKMIRMESKTNISTMQVNNLSFCDLAGSERCHKTQNMGERLQEAARINNSLLVLGRCLAILRENKTLHRENPIPFRDSKLTRLVSGFFTGRGKAAMIVNISPSSYTYEETLNVLKFSAIAKQVTAIDDHLSSRIGRLSNVFKSGALLADQSLYSESSYAEDSYNYEDEIKERDEIIQELLAKVKELAAKYDSLYRSHSTLEVDLKYDIRLKIQAEFDKRLKTARDLYEGRINQLEKADENRCLNAYKDIFRHSDTEDDDEDEEDDEDNDDDENNDDDEDNKQVLQVDENSIDQTNCFKTPYKCIDNGDNYTSVCSSTIKRNLPNDDEIENLQNELTAVKNERDVKIAELENLLKDARNEKESLENQNAELKEAAKKAEEAASEHVKIIEELRKMKEKNTEMSKIVSNNKVTQDSLKQANDELKNKNKELQSVYSATNQKLQLIQKEAEGYSETVKEVSEMKLKLEKLEKENANLSTMLGQNENTDTEYQKKVNDLEELISNQEEEISSLNEEISQAREKECRLEQTFSDLRGVVSTKEEKISNLESSISCHADLENTIKQELKDSKKILASKEQKIQALERDISNNEAVKLSQSQEIEELNTLLTSKQLQIQALEEGELSDLKKKLKEMSRKNAELVKAAEGHETVERQISSELSELRDQIEQLSKEMAQLIKEKEEAAKDKQQIEDLQKELSSKEQTISSLQQDAENHQASVNETSELKVKLSDMSKKNKQLDKQLNKANEGHSETIKEMETLKSMLGELTKKNTNLSKDMDKLKEANAKEIDQLNDALLTRAAEIVTLEDANEGHSETINELETLKSKLSVLTKKNADLSKDMNKLKEVHATEISQLNATVSSRDARIVTLENDAEKHAAIMNQSDEMKSKVSELAKENSELAETLGMREVANDDVDGTFVAATNQREDSNEDSSDDEAVEEQIVAARAAPIVRQPKAQTVKARPSRAVAAKKKPVKATPPSKAAAKRPLRPTANTRIAKAAKFDEDEDVFQPSVRSKKKVDLKPPVAEPARRMTRSKAKVSETPVVASTSGISTKRKTTAPSYLTPTNAHIAKRVPPTRRRKLHADNDEVVAISPKEPPKEVLTAEKAAKEMLSKITGRRRAARK